MHIGLQLRQPDGRLSWPTERSIPLFHKYGQYVDANLTVFPQIWRTFCDIFVARHGIFFIKWDSVNMFV